MQRIFLILLASILTLHAQDAISSGPNLLDSCDFSKSLSGWHGDGNLSSSNTNPLADQPSGPPTMDIVLSPNHWSKVAEDFNTKYPTLRATILYKLSPDVIFSDKSDDYVNITHALDFNGLSPIDGKKGYWEILLTDFSAGHFWDYLVKLDKSKTGPHTYTMKLDKINTEAENKTISLAFPPGQGTISIINVTATP